jgi:C-terminal processing protease CtpA/Prc
MTWSWRSVLLAGALHGVVAPTAAATEFEEDFLFAHEHIAAAYAYFDAKSTRWREIPALYRSDVAAVTNRTDFVRVMERVVDELYDHHAQLKVNTASSPRLVPAQADLWAEWRGTKAIVVEVRDASDAARAGIRPGDEIVALNGVPIEALVDRRMGRSYPHSEPRARDWALRAVLAGIHGSGRDLVLDGRGGRRTVTLPGRDQFPCVGRAPLTSSRLPLNIGLVRFNDSLGDAATIAAFDEALDGLRDAAALIVDLRDTPSGGNTSVARGILGRFVDRETPYQKHVLPSEQRQTGVWRGWVELVAPRGPFRFTKPVAVLVDHWTGSMGEGLAMGFDAAIGAKIVGTPMAGLLGATYTITLPRTGIAINIPAERLYHVSGVPREAFVPTTPVDVTSARGDDPILDAARRALGATGSE